MESQPEAITTLFDQQADNYQQRYIDGMLAHYAPDAELLFWSSENVSCTTQHALRVWYESLFDQFEIDSVQYRVESFWTSGQIIGCCSIWQFETRMKKEGSSLELQSLRATHILKKIGNEWKIVHLHASPQ
ncbi:hypothetical protein GZ77_15350 [Endozoicomonas montiporae]|uniref:SnoaL-like domain-containing protein n=2 Tax=Endozoicomonas montiporae TaxID=1027273 RepID=A0A081N5F6_9GAMM|nr:nuclear transport factor 2 family protein [Endozoicomonas montiporae]AMO57437.1 calcium/calmodulin dependent protein kinase II association domain [Endozoicomonas montiporae CL-33]KEQ13679.1 hypothetical protein GZ77_15350 [Endozoicomonas montiporae]